LKELVFFLIFLGLSTAFAVAALVASFICAPKTDYEDKKTTYECGLEPFSDARVQFDIKYFNYAIMFLVFDVESIFLFPFAISFMQLKIFAIVEVAIFITLLLFALFFAVNKDLLRWQ
jgi:NADH-quinone oxidoreductase subunit A